jgi:uncharacterized OB-fold protein
MTPLRPLQLVPDDVDAPFWEACRDERFLVYRCKTCNRAYWPAGACIDHGPASMEWQPASGRGEVHTYTVVHHAYDKSIAERIPFAIAVIRLDEGPFFHSDIVGCDPADLRVGLRVRATYERVDAETVIPHFTPEVGAR